MSFRHHSKYPKVLLIFLAILLIGFVSLSYKTHRVKQESFSGTLPCADCPGIDTQMTFISRGSSQGTYTLKLIYRDRNVEPFVEQGTWSSEKNSDDKIVYSTYDGIRLSGKYLRVDSQTIRQIGLDGVPFDAQMNFDLKKLSSESVAPYTK